MENLNRRAPGMLNRELPARDLFLLGISDSAVMFIMSQKPRLFLQ